MFSNEIRPYQSHADHCYEPRDTFHIPQMRVLDIESGRLHRPEERLNLPSLLIRLYGVLRMIEAYKNLKFRNTPAVFESCIILKTKCSDKSKRNVYFHKTKCSFFNVFR